MKITTVGLDLAKSVFQVHGVGAGQAILRRRLKRPQVLCFFAQLPPCLIGMEACGGAHYWARKLAEQGHTVRLISPQFVKPFVKSNKNDMADAEAICEAVQRPNMRFVPVKSTDQQAVLAVHRAREGFVGARVAIGNQIRGLLAEFGLVLPKGKANLARVPALLSESGVPATLQHLIEGLLAHYRQLETRTTELEQQLQAWHRSNEASQRLVTIPGVGVISATAMVATVGDARQFRNSRQMAAWLGLVPRQHSTGGKPTLLGISKRGDGYLRRLLIHGGRAVLRKAPTRPNAGTLWHVRVMRRRNKNIAAVALANKNARIIWALLARQATYDPFHRAAEAA